MGPELIRKFFGSFVRHGLSVAAGAFVAKGVIDQQTAQAAVGPGTEVVLGVLAYMIGQGLSLLEKKNRPA
jgi:hypothetical protein